MTSAKSYLEVNILGSVETKHFAFSAGATVPRPFSLSIRLYFDAYASTRSRKK